MSIEWRTSGSIFDTLAEPRPLWLIDPVCSVAGIMGKGLALEFFRRWPALKRWHEQSVCSDLLKPGMVVVCPVSLTGLQVVLFPTKDHWRRPSRLEWIEAGLTDLAAYLAEWDDPVTVAVPGLGCGLGGLCWESVRPLIQATADILPRHRFLVYVP